MSQAIDHPAWNFTFGPPPGEEERVGSIRVFITVDPTQRHITSVTSCWELSDADIEEIVRTRRIMMNTMGGGLRAHFIGTESTMKEFVTVFGKTWS